MKNKKADIAITILVIMIIVLCSAALFSFYYVDVDRKSSGINSVVYLQHVYNIAESVKFSEGLGQNLYESYGMKEQGVIEKKFLDGKLKITYSFGGE